MLYQNNTPQPIEPGVYHSPSLWLISLSSDWETRTTIADKNLWATEVYNQGDAATLSKFWYRYQFWNNYWFWNNFNKIRWPISLEWYWPNNYYYCEDFIINGTYPYKIWTVPVPDLWWCITGTYEALRWPCSEWYHVPTREERDDLITLWIDINAWDRHNRDMIYILHMPKCWALNKYWGLDWLFSSAIYWSATCLVNDYYRQGQTRWFFCEQYTSSHWVTYEYTSTESCPAITWAPIRPFKNEPVTPDDNRIKLF